MATILVVDDNVRLANTIASFLTMEAHDVTEAHSAEEAIESIGLNPPDICLLDINMPGIDGLEICRRIKGAVPATTVLIMSGRTASDDQAQALAAGAAEHLPKPMSLVMLREAIARYAPAAPSEDS